ncbi:MAG: hypothetical protein HXX14_00930 [Bacteroidetes bacterium]|nr:hypothetical protein [Bacteroidota bacterium]
MKKLVVLSVLFFAFYLIGFCQKLEGPVQKKELVGKYKGSQVNGLAQGKGTAIGSDTYSGKFKKGLPDGKGIYTDSVGNVFKGTFRKGMKNGKGVFIPVQFSKEQGITGYWRNDRYTGKEQLIPFEISNKTGSVTPRIYTTGPGDRIELSIIDPVDNSYITSGSVFITKGQATFKLYYGCYFYEDAIFPIEFDIHYNCRNKIGTSTIDNTIRIKMNKPGNWIVNLKN